MRLILERWASARILKNKLIIILPTNVSYLFIF